MARGPVGSAEEKPVMTVTEQKSALRRQMQAASKTISAEKRRADSQKLCALLAARPFFQDAASILFFAPLPGEIDIWPLLEKALAADKVAALPCFDADDRVYRSRRVKNLHVEIVSGKFGIREPATSCIEMPLDQLGLVLVPGVAFDAQGNRLGRGKGFYDRLLKDFRGIKAAIAFDEQLTAEVPSEKNDVRMDYVVTPTRCVEIGR